MNKISWLLVQFTYPKSSNIYAVSNKFKRDMVKIGFSQTIKDSYAIHGTDETLTAKIDHVKSIVPIRGRVSILKFTDEQFGNIINYSNTKKAGVE